MALHRPITFRWAEKFGLTPEGAKEEMVIKKPTEIPVEEDRTAETTDNKATEPQATESKATPEADADQKKKLQCSQCEAAVSYAVAKFCWNNRKFGGKVLCMSCQKG